ncbi:MAG: type II secretion system protein H [Paracoccaceae bacterium]|jgi:type II secretion system protein H
MVMKGARIWPVISVTGDPHLPVKQCQQGMTLLELMLVLLIIGLLSAAAVLTLPSDNDERDMRQLSERLVSYFRYARQEAVFTGTSHGILWQGGRPLLVKRSTSGWDIQDDSRLSSLHNAASRYPMFLERSKQLLDLSQDYQTPQILFTNDGQVSPFVLIIRGKEGRELSLNDSLTLEQAE